MSSSGNNNISNFRRVKFLLRKNIKTKLRTYRSFCVQVSMICLFMIIIRINRIIREEPKVTGVRSIKLDNTSFIPESMRSEFNIKKWAIGYSPSNEIFTPIVKQAAEVLGITEAIPFDSREEMEKAMFADSMIAIIEFPLHQKDITKIPKNFKISLRFPGEFRTYVSTTPRENLWATHTTEETDSHYDGRYGRNLYISEGFLQLQNAIFMEFYKKLVADLELDLNPPDVTVHSFALYTTDNQIDLADITNINGVMYYLCFLLPCVYLIKEISREKAENIMVHYLLNGFPFWTHWVAHFIAAIVCFFILDIVIIILLKITAPPSGHIILLILFLLLFNVAAILFSFVIVAICRRVNIGIIVLLILWVLMFSIFAIIMEKSNILSIGLVLGSFLFFNNALSFGLRSLQRINEDLSEILEQYNEIGWIFGMLLLDSLLYFVILCAVEIFYRSPYTDRRSIRSLSKIETDIERQEPELTITAPRRQPIYQNIEFESIKSIEAVRCKKISKVENGKARIRNISASMYENEITVLLGHSGSGMTTLLCCIAGYKKPSAGVVSFYGVDVNEANYTDIRKNVSFCPPNNILFDYLTVQEHLIYKMHIARVDTAVRNYEVIKWMGMLKLHKYARTQIRKLTFEKKRFLCLAMALCGQSKIVLMDKPTMNMKVHYRKYFWDVVRSQKRGRCIIVSTNSVVEAESVGDRIAILDHGNLLAFGTQYFLRVKYAYVYYLILIKTSTCQTYDITRIVSEFVPDFDLLNETSDQIHYRISSEYGKSLPKLFSTLEQKSAALGLVSVNIVGSQLSDVYMSFGGDLKSPERLYRRGQSVMRDMRLEKGLCLTCNQVSAMLFKKFLYQIPNRIPCIMIILSAVLILILGQMSKYMMFQYIRHSEIEIGFRNQRESGEVFKKILSAEYTGANHLAEAYLIEAVDKNSRVITWGSSIKHTTTEKVIEDAVVNDRVAIGLPNKNSNEATIWFNENLIHSAPLSLNLLHNSLLRMATKSPNYRTKVSNKPLIIPLTSQFKILEEDQSHMRLPLMIGTITPFLISSFIYYVVIERETHVRSLQFVAGIKIPIYWLVPLLWDLCTFFVLIFLFTVVFLLLTVDGYEKREKLAIFLNLNIFGFAALCETYLISFYFKRPIAAYLTASLVHITLGLFMYVVFWDFFDENEPFWWIAMVSPDFAMLDGMSMVYIEKSQKTLCEDELKRTGESLSELCDEYYECCYDTLFKWVYPGLLPCITFLILFGLIFLITILGVEYYIYERKFDKHDTEFLHSACGPTQHIEVLAEKQRINEMSNREIATYNMVVDQLEDSIPEEGSQLRTVSFAIHSKECLVILAEKNCGTTQLMHQLIGEEGFSFGDVYVKGINIKENLAAVRSMLGFCAMKKGLLYEITGRQLMKIMCLIRGVPSNKINLVISEMIMLLEMQEFIAKKLGTLSMQKKRRINIAIAFIADVQVLLIDEPTFGISPLARNTIWNVLRYARFIGKSVVFTTTDPWECEAMADRVIIFSDGEMLFYGALQLLRNEFSHGIMFEVKVKKDGQTAEEIKNNFENDITNMMRFVTFMAVDSELRSILDGALKFYIPIRTVTWSRVFDLIERNRERLKIESYILNQASFEDIMHNLMIARGADVQND